MTPEERAEEIKDHGYPWAYGYLACAVEGFLDGVTTKDALRKSLKRVEAAIRDAPR